MTRPPADMTVTPIAPSDLAGFIRSAEARYAEQKTAMGAIPADEARRQAHAETAAMFPDGQLSEGHTVLEARQQGDHPVGWVWVGPHRVEHGLAFIYDIGVTPDARGQGIGTLLLDAVHGWARGRGYQAVSLHIFAGNPAITLYESHGYETTDLLMRRTL